MKGAAIIITDADYVFLTTAWDTRTTQEVSIDTSAQLLADLRDLAAFPELLTARGVTLEGDA